ncbi:LOW QUALITY PROTEIN: ABC transporter B family member 15-like [Solanum pennellii]|uniref:LOW QUALITY PROTEIN: ABC transporter B family member 15-like n=1 Tax=Solanum pennellii TaxID=28526 RepID=A0ABM1V1J7_SOLPN|nr:LOW QUALITY PROTEIN: ABC transporter B family member 15-like [Solanum pennellii]
MLSKGKEVDYSVNVATTSTSGIHIALMTDVVNANWIIDTGASNHMVHNLSLISQSTDLGDKRQMNVNLPTGDQVPITHVGESILLKDKTDFFNGRVLGIGREDQVLYLFNTEFSASTHPACEQSSHRSCAVGTLVDDMSRYTWIFLMHTKSDTITALQHFLCMVNTRTAKRKASRLRIRYLKSVLRQDVAFKASVSDDCLVIQDFIGEKVPLLLRDISTFIGAYVVGFLMIWRLVLVISSILLLLLIPNIIYQRALERISRQVKDESDKAGNILKQVISSIRTVYSFVGERKSIEDYCVALEGCVELGVKQSLVKGLFFGSYSFVTGFAIRALLSYYGSILVMYNGVHGGNVYMTSYVTLACFFFPPNRSLASGFLKMKEFAKAVAANKRVMEVIKMVPKIDSENMEGQALDNMTGEIEFKHIKFAYPSGSKSIGLIDFSLKIPRGKTVALVGGSGSAVIALLQRFYAPLSGEILLDGVVINKLQPKWLRYQMSLVSKEPALFATTIKENILFGKEDASMEQVIEAAKASNAHDFICKLPQGYNTKVGEKGIQMSEGQKQRIAIARAIIRSPKILLLDEATSALDTASERVVQEALDNASTGRTTIIVASRLSTTRNADFIAFIQNGQVKEIGSHDELIKNQQNGLYASLVRLQQNEKPTGSTIASSRQSSSIANRGDTSVPSTSGQGSFKRLLAMNLPEWKQATLGCIGAILVGGVVPVYAFLMGALISVSYSTSRDEIKRKTKMYTLAFLGMAFITLLLNVLQHYNFAVMGERLIKRVRERMLSKMLTFEVGWYEKEQNSTAAICSRLTDDASVVRSLVGDRISLFIQTTAGMTIACTVGLVIAWRMGLVMIAIQAVIILCIDCRKVLLEKSIKSQEESSKLAAEAVTNLQTITAFNSQSRILQMLKEAQEGPLRENIRQSWLWGIVFGTTISIQSCTWALFFWFGGYFMVEGYIGAQALFQILVLLLCNLGVIAELGTMTKDLATGTNAVSSVFATLDRYSLIEPEDSDGYKPKKITGHIEMCEVDFAYPTRPNVIIFKGFSITIDAGKSTALVGQSGSGKSTIIGLIERFYDPLSGVVKIDGRDIRSYHLKSLRKHIALVSQEPTLFRGTIRENIAYGVLASEEVDESEIIEAAKAANVHSFISALKDGYDTWCGDKGLQLTGGQKQRIAIARAILKNPRVLLLDEATSGLDDQLEKLVQEAVERVMVGRTSVVVAHRLSNIQNCDTVVVLDKGKVVEKGTHSSLLAKRPCGVYYSLVSSANHHP